MDHPPSRPRTRAQLVTAGHDPCHGDHLVRTGALVRAAPSVYLLPDALLADRIAAALAHAGQDALLTGWAACTLLRLPYVTDGGAVDVLVPSGRRRVSTAYVRVLPTTRPPRWWTHGDVRVAAPPRAVIDAARSLRGLRPVRALVLGAVRVAGLLELEAELRAGSRGGRALVARALRDAAAGAASCPEAEAADVALALARRGLLPPFLLNPDLFVDGVFVGRPDGWVVGAGFGWEVESREHHGADDAFEQTLARSDRFLARGLSLLHVTPRRLRIPGSDWPGVLSATAQARSGFVEPPGLVVRARGPLLEGRRRPGR